MEIGSLNNSLQHSKALLGRMQELGELQDNPPLLYRSWVVPCSSFERKWQSPHLADFFVDIHGSSASFFLQNRTSHHQKSRDKAFLIRARNDLIRLLCVAVKAHYFLFRRDVLAEPPSIFPIPDLQSLNTPRFALLYPLLSAQHAVIVSTQDLSFLTSSTLGMIKFPVVLSHDQERWLKDEAWKDLDRAGSVLKDLMKTTKNKTKIHQWKERGTFPYGTPLEIEATMAPDMRDTGIRWAEGIQAWYLPKGFDLEPVKEYMDYLKAQAKENDISHVF